MISKGTSESVLRFNYMALTVAQWLEHRTSDPIPCQGYMLWLQLPQPSKVPCRRQPIDVSVSHQCFSLCPPSPSLLLSLEIMEKIWLGEGLKKKFNFFFFILYFHLSSQTFDFMFGWRYSMALFSTVGFQ